jgi:hypothetical protein
VALADVHQILHRLRPNFCARGALCVRYGMDPMVFALAPFVLRHRMTMGEAFAANLPRLEIGDGASAFVIPGRSRSEAEAQTLG